HGAQQRLCPGNERLIDGTELREDQGSRVKHLRPRIVSGRKRVPPAPSKSQTCIAIYQSVARSPCSLTASRRYDMLMLLARAERTPWQAPNWGGEVRQGVRPPHDGGGHDH